MPFQPLHAHSINLLRVYPNFGASETRPSRRQYVVEEYMRRSTNGLHRMPGRRDGDGFAQLRIRRAYGTISTEGLGTPEKIKDIYYLKKIEGELTGRMSAQSSWQIPASLMSEWTHQCPLGPHIF
ncbi:hypothetical protein EVAR_28891_1 [Eumeta japonica]|uniref:Uncharacterized protein n=1 Tax=Eumeta variegata TaxID=151549 RepID=A0A4C1WY66_EUMVA|nr:hypothetical protein EVAR_28891_1 [Eumeta japonica]